MRYILLVPFYMNMNKGLRWMKIQDKTVFCYNLQSTLIKLSCILDKFIQDKTPKYSDCPVNTGHLAATLTVCYNMWYVREIGRCFHQKGGGMKILIFSNFGKIRFFLEILYFFDNFDFLNIFFSFLKILIFLKILSFFKILIFLKILLRYMGTLHPLQ